MNNPIVMALVVALMYGIAGPLMKVGMGHGASHLSMIFAYGISCVVLTMSISASQTFTFGSGKTPLLVMLIGATFAVAFWLFGHALSMPNTSPTILLSVTAIYPLVSCVVEIGFKLSKYDPMRMGIGAAIIVAGIIVLNSAEQKVAVAAQ